jgi:hypothetical protein
MPVGGLGYGGFSAVDIPDFRTLRNRFDFEYHGVVALQAPLSNLGSSKHSCRILGNLNWKFE